MWGPEQKLDSVSKKRKSSVARSISDLDRSFAASVVGDQLLKANFFSNMCSIELLTES